MKIELTFSKARKTAVRASRFDWRWSNSGLTPRHWKSFTVGVAIVLLASIYPQACLAHGTNCQLTLVQARPLIVDPACDTCDQGPVEILLRNDNPNFVALELSVGRLENSETHKIMWSRAEIVATDPRDPSGTFLHGVEPGKFVTVTVKIFGVKESGEWDAHLFNRGTDLGKFSVVKMRRPFVIVINQPGTEPATVDTEEGGKIEIPIRNADAVDYTVDWKLDVGGASVGSVTSTVPAGGSDLVPFDLPANLKRLTTLDRFEFILKGKSVDAHLIATLKAEDPTETSQAPTKIIPLKIRLHSYSENLSAFWRMVAIFAILILGASVSLLSNAVLPNLTKRRTLKGRLKTLEIAIRSLPMDLSSKLRVLVSVERRRLSEILTAINTWDSDFSRTADDVSVAIDSLQKRVTCIQRLGALRTQFAPCTQILIPSLIERIETSFDDAVLVLVQDPFGELETAAFQTIARNIQDLLARLDAIKTAEKVDDQLLADLRLGLTELRQEIGVAGNLTPRYADYSVALGTLIQDLWSIDENQITPKRYPHVDQVVYKLSLLQQLVDAKLSLQPSTPVETLRAQEDLVVRDLQQASWTSIEWARLRIREMQDGYFKQDVVNAIRGEVTPVDSNSIARDVSVRGRIARFFRRIYSHLLEKTGFKDVVTRTAVTPTMWLASRGVQLETSSSEPRPFQAVQLKIRFTNESLNCAAARYEFTPVWDFGDEGLTSEKGWSVTHYFPEKKVYTVRIWFEDRGSNPSELHSGADRVYAAHRFAVGAAKDRGVLIKAGAQLAIFGLIISLIPVLLALYGGASDQLSKLDLIPGVFAVFLLGFTSDQVKNLLIKQG